LEEEAEVVQEHGVAAKVGCIQFQPVAGHSESPSDVSSNRPHFFGGGGGGGGGAGARGGGGAGEKPSNAGMRSLGESFGRVIVFSLLSWWWRGRCWCTRWRWRWGVPFLAKIGRWWWWSLRIVQCYSSFARASRALLDFRVQISTMPASRETEGRYRHSCTRL